MIELTDSLSDMVESSAAPLTLDEVVARADGSGARRSRARRPILVALVTVIAAVLAVALVTHSSDHATSTPRPPVTRAIGPAFSAGDVSVASATDVWVSGATGDFAPRVFRTSDGGHTWTDVTPALTPHDEATGLFAVDDTHALLSIITDPGEDDNRAAILRTVDGGRTWSSTPIIGADTAYFSFVDSLHGWVESSLGSAAGSEGVDIFRTLDGGEHWQLMSRGGSPSGDPGTPGALSAGCDKTGITFIDAKTGFATEACEGGSPSLYVTHDAGRTWKPVAIHGSGSVPEGGGTEITPPVFSGRDGAAWLGAGKTTLVVLTSDRGETWSIKTLPPSADRFPVDIVDATHWWFVIGSHIEYTADAGEHFVTRTAPPGTVAQLQFATERSGWAISDDGSLFATSDGARTWRLVASPIGRPGPVTAPEPVRQ